MKIRKFEVGDRCEWRGGPEGTQEVVVSWVSSGGDDETAAFMDKYREMRMRPVDELLLIDPEPNQASGSLNNYYLSRVDFPQREDQPAYTAECEDLIESLRLTPDEANIFKEIWRSANARLGNGKPDHKALYGAEKINHYAGRILRKAKRAE